ncbi:tail assembly chaperone [Arthrobacter phage BruhMoment]|nr:tail assembly chaperone [Arthrobacter phage BruhMoment]
MKEFTTAVTAADAEENEANPTTFLHKSSAAPDGFECVFFEPSEGQFLMMLSMGGRGMKKESIGHFIQLFIELADDETQKYFHDLLMTRNSGFKVKGPGGIFDIWEYLVSEWTGKRFGRAVRLGQACIGHWALIDGSLPQVDLLSLPVHRILNIVYVWMAERMDTEARQKWETELDSPLPGEKARDITDTGFDDGFNQINRNDDI